MIKKTFLIALWILLIQSCSFAQTAAYHKMLNQMYENTVPILKSEEVNDTFIILDTREYAEYKVSHLKNAIWVGYDDFSKKRIKAISKEKTILVYCSVGYRSERIGEKLQKIGYTKVYNLYGGIFEWVNNNYKIYDINTKETSNVHVFDKTWGVWLQKGEKIYE